MNNLFHRDNFATFVGTLTYDQQLSLRRALIRGTHENISNRKIEELIFIDTNNDDSDLVKDLKKAAGPKKIVY